MARLKDFGQVVSARKRLTELQPDLLANELKRIFDELSILAQDDMHAKAEAADYADQVILPSILRHKDKSIRILASCCVANILRIYAPEAPYSAQQLDVNNYAFHSLGLFPDCAATTEIHNGHHQPVL